MLFIETSLFTKQVSEYLEEKEYLELQEFLIEQPDAGVIIKDTGGLRKLRWSTANKGKRGGIRIIYYWKTANDHIYLMTLFAKNETIDLSSKEKRELKQMLERW